MCEIDVNEYLKVFDDDCEYFMEYMIDELEEDIVNKNKQLHQLKQENELLKERLSKFDKI